jgi:hypothetical protein
VRASYLFFFFSILFASIGFFLWIPISVGHFYLTLIFTLGFTAVSCIILIKKNVIQNLFLIIGLLAITFLLFLFISQHFYDLSYDGQASHQEAVFQLGNGWNPFHKQLNKAEANNLQRWLNHYTKGTWVYETIVFKMTHNMESAKLFHLWLISAAFCLTFSFLLKLRYLPPYIVFFLSLLVAFNPVSIYQSLSFYLDGQLMSLLVMLIVTLGNIYVGDKNYHYWLLFLIVPVLLNTKLTAGAYTALILAGFMVMLWSKKRRSGFKKVFVVGMAASLTGFFLIGMSPYITNTMNQGNPFYPVFGPDQDELYKNMNMPGNFQDKNSAVILFYSIFSKSDNVRFRDSRAELKIPFTIVKGELKAFRDTNAKEGGFGPLFGGAIILSFITIGAASIKFYRGENLNKKKNKTRETQRKSVEKFRIAIFCLALVLITCLINPASSLARFVPQMWLFPIVSILLAYGFKSNRLKMIGKVIILVLFVNELLIGASYYGYNLRTTNLYNKTLEEMAIMSRQNPLKIYFGHFKTSGTLRLDRFGIRYEIVKNKEECHNGQRILPNSILLKCF